MFAGASALHIDCTLNHVFYRLLGFLKLLYLCAVVCNILMEVTIPDVALHTGVQAQGGGFLFALDNNISQTAKRYCNVGIP